MIVLKDAAINDKALFTFMKEYDPRVFRCSFCETEFLADKSEYSKIISAESKSLPESYVVKCPTCGSQRIYNRFDTIDPNTHDLRMLLSAKTEEANRNKQANRSTV